jgi:hypothetical protein
MNEARKRTDWPIVAALVLAALLAGTGVYFGCYFAMSEDVAPFPARGLAQSVWGWGTVREMQ